MTKKIALLLICLLSNLAATQSLAELQKIRLPITIDYPLLRSLIASQAFPEEGELITLLDRGEGCVKLIAAHPQVSESSGLVRFEVQVDAQIGTPLGSNCFAPIEWQGFLILNQKPILNPNTWQLSFTTDSSEVLQADRQPAKIAAMLWDMIEPRVTAHLAGITIDLLPPVQEIKSFLFPLFPADRQQQTEKMLATMLPAQIEVSPGSLDISISAEVDAVFDPEQGIKNQQLNQEELQQTITNWERLDSFLVYMVTTLSRQMLNVEEKHDLVNMLLDTRHRFVVEMADQSIQQEIVRQQFVSAWQVMSPIFRRHLLKGDQISQALGYLAFVSSADALLVFDKLGPTFGLEISTRGLVRLMHMLNADPDLLQYHQGINRELQRHFDIEQNDDEKIPPPPPDNSLNDNSLLQLFIGSLSPKTAYATDFKPDFAEILRWKVPKSEVVTYVNKVEKLLTKTTELMIKRKKVPVSRQKLFRLLIPAMAWQESCFRQFVVKEKKLTYLLSYNQSSVGLMQVNERVWRGIYDLTRLRWDIHYNARAGSEIAARYLNKYALRDAKKAASITDDTLARLVYAMYNGGPSQHKKFYKRLEQNKFYTSDNLFWEKFLLVKDQKVDQVSVCLVGS